MRIAVGADHAGFELKEHLRAVLAQAGHEVDDLGTRSAESTDYPDWAHRVAEAVAGGAAERGLLVCGTGVGMAIAANRHRGVRAAACNDLYTARLARAHNDANLLALGARIVAPALAEAILAAFVETPFEGGRHSRRVAKLDGSGS
ncbi:MAG: ribose 5-phosphate isomerase B [Thermoanaerobaculia bacterium]|nr:MAG: ribose 5-phosphate isomerase B [Thermoanaerobaculia bacterium]